MSLSRRQLIKHLGALLSIAPVLVYGHAISGTAFIRSSSDAGNFRYIYGDQKRRQHFLNFLSNVFHLFPEDELDRLIASLTKSKLTDQDIYNGVQDALPGIKPFLSDLTYALPALYRQKKIIALQTQELMGERKHIEGYLEFGSAGRYLDSLEEIYDVVGLKYLVAERQPESSLADIVDRGQRSVDGQFMLLDNYKVDLVKNIQRGSLDMVSVYIGFHHCPLNLRDSFISSIRDVLKPGGVLVVRDHDAHDEDMFRCVALAHDVFNLGTLESWGYNAAELRHFYPLATLDSMLVRNGFRTDGRKLYQKGDPTLNALMLYRKV